MDIPQIIGKQLADYLETKRPSEEQRGKLDLGYTIKDQSIELFEIRPQWNDPNQQTHMPIAKTIYVKSRGIWKVYWMPSTLKWTLYEPTPEVSSIHEFIDIVDKDEHHCFWG